jgi:arylsulfatase A-like enzyme
VRASLAVVPLILADAFLASGPRAAPPNVVIITLDTTRADRLSPYGFMNVSLPSLERLARDGVVFDQATSVAPLTLPAHASLFTGLLPPRHGVRDNADPALAEAHTTLAEILRARGYRTGAFVGSVVLDPARGLGQGFETYAGVTAASTPAAARHRRGDAVVDDALGWVGILDRSPFLLWVHLYDPHLPYQPPEPYASIYGHNPYVGEIAFADAQIGRLLAALDARASANATIVVVAADHGESLGDHGEQDHGVFVYETVLRVPLIVHAPSIAPRRVGGVVRLTDVMPTVLALLGLPAPPTDGVSLLELLDGRRATLDLEAYSESEYPRRFGWSPLRALRDGRFKLIDAPRPELYDLERDPFETRNVHAERRSTAAAMTRRLRELAGPPSPLGPEPAGDPAPVPRDLAEPLAALGYVSRSRQPPAANASLPDPKDCISFYRSRQDRAGSILSPARIRCQ